MQQFTIIVVFLVSNHIRTYGETQYFIGRSIFVLCKETVQVTCNLIYHFLDCWISLFNHIIAMIMLMFSEKVIRLEILEYMSILLIFLMCGHSLLA